ncbi:hypothetical protein HXX76_013282 [Chlamydomonas incerta]|uniref:Uncharacterized protein n=1 Tax=Chlamydomonas incerta TaxID=51695 RepID=A0A835SPY8_CHLIN|nr:hypothetical protein HXX76_013282 [Chlamydomonas incerta]|eukprot:KAG2426094.1 hypothetical protein HXX76_013282 [Chlamydomonas incerta]
MVLTVIGTGLAVTMALSSALSTVKADLRADIDRQGVEITRQGSELKADLARQGSEIKADLARAENRWYTVSQKVAAVEAVVDLLTPPQQPK